MELKAGGVETCRSGDSFVPLWVSNLMRIGANVAPAASLESKLSIPDEDDGDSEGEFIYKCVYDSSSEIAISSGWTFLGLFAPLSW